MSEATIEQMIVAMEKTGWRMSNLSFIGNAPGYSCILERKKLAASGQAVFAFNRKELHPTAREAVADAWANAREPIDNPRIVQQIKAGLELPPLANWLDRHIGHRIRLEDAVAAAIKALTGEEDEDDDFL